MVCLSIPLLLRTLAHSSSIQAHPFDECYDARARYQSKTIMRRLPVEDLKLGDLVLLEARINRYSTNQSEVSAREKARVRAKGPSEWAVTFELVSLSLMRSAPLSFKFKPAEDVPDFSDEI